MVALASQAIQVASAAVHSAGLGSYARMVVVSHPNLKLSFPGIHNVFSDVNECANDDPCQFGRCVNELGGYKCYCVPGYSGQNCDQNGT